MVTVPVPGSTEIHAIKFEGFKKAIDQMMDYAYAIGQQEAFSKASDIVTETFNRV